MVKKKQKTPYHRANKTKTIASPNSDDVLASKSVLQQARTLHKAGQLTQAENLYKQILQTDPNNPTALYFAGTLADQIGKVELAIELISKALNSNPDNFRAHHRLGCILSDHGKYDEAVACFRQAITLKPDYTPAYNNLGNALKDQGKLEDAVTCYRKALSLNPGFAEARYNLGITLKSQGKFDEAIISFRQTLSLKPGFFEAYFNLGNIYRNQGKLDDAVTSYRQALKLKPDYVQALGNLGIVLSNQNKLDDAVAYFRQALKFKPDSAQTHYNLANTLKIQDKSAEAIDSYRQALKLKPDFAEAYYNLGNVLTDEFKLGEAAACFRQASILKPDFALAYNNLGIALRKLGKLDEAVTNYRQALSLNREYAEAHSNLLFCMNYFPNLSVSQYLEEARQFGRIMTDMVSIHFSDWICSSNPERLRVGLVSGDFQNHPVGFFLENLLTNIDSTQLALIAYSTKDFKDELTIRIRDRFTAWKQLADMSDEAAARQIHDDGIHILLDLSGHTAHNRLPVFASKPAPVQATWLGYFASTGMAEMDYIIADPITVPESLKDHFTEEVWYLPDTRFCFSPPVTEEELRPSPLPALSNGYITFGCYQNTVKINDAVLTAWGHIFQSLPNARLRLRDRLLYSGTIRRQLQTRLEKHGIDLKQVILEKSVPRDEYLASYTDIDIILDTFPFNGGTTTCEALWMGVPTVTLLGNTMISRQGASLLISAGLTDWIAEDVERYVAKTIEHAAGLDKLARLRAGLRRQVLASPLFDGRRFARHFEEAMWGMWKKNVG